MLLVIGLEGVTERLAVLLDMVAVFFCWNPFQCCHFASINCSLT